jgi:hypothetical protein
VRRALAMLALGAATLAPAATGGDVPIPAFSAAAPGDTLPQGWSPVLLPYGRHAEFKLVRDDGHTVLQVHSNNAFGAVAHTLDADPASSPILAWRWKVDRVVQGADMNTKEGEDFAARVYVSFDYPLEKLSAGTRTKLRLARAFFGFVPAVAICYVWDNRHPPGTAVWSPHYDHVRVIVLESGNGRAGQWVEEKRDVDADFRAAFGTMWEGPTPKIAAVVAGNDSDQTNEAVTAWFGDFHLGARH